MRARLAKKIVKASPLYEWYCNLFGKKPCKHQYWLQKWEKRRRITIYHQEGKYDYRLLVAPRKMNEYCRFISFKIRNKEKQ